MLLERDLIKLFAKNVFFVELCNALGKREIICDQAKIFTKPIKTSHTKIKSSFFSSFGLRKASKSEKNKIKNWLSRSFE